MKNDPPTQPVGAPLPNWQGSLMPLRKTIVGRYCSIEPFDLEKHAPQLFNAYITDAENSIWDYLPRGPYQTLAEYQAVAKLAYTGDDPLVYAIIDPITKLAVGQASFMNIDAKNGCIEIGGVIFSPALKKNRAGSEAMYLMMRHAFDDLGYRRCAWQCNALNQASQKAAQRLGFTFEGIFRQAAIVKTCNRDTAWYSILDSEWPNQREKFEKWLDVNNFNNTGSQRVSMAAI